MIDLQFVAQMQDINVFTPEWWGQLLTPEDPEQLISTRLKLTISAILTLGLYSLLYRENKFYRLVEHIFVGLATGYSVFAIWAHVLEPQWWRAMVGHPPTTGIEMQLAYWAWALLLPVGMLAYLVFSEKHGWMSRIPIGLIIGLWAGQQLDAFMGRFLPQVVDQARPIIPNKFGLTDAADPLGTIALPSAINNLIVVITFIIVLAYFIYSFEAKSKLLHKSAVAGRLLLMVGFGAIFGTTMMTRFVLFIDRAYFLLVEWLGLAPPA